jgi:hypothetical protein
MIYPQPLAIVIRNPNVVVTRLELEAALQCQVARYERLGVSNYAQLDIAETPDQWSAAIEYIRAISGRIERLISEGAIGRPSLDVALRFPDLALSASASIPANLAEAAGRAGMDIDISVYRTEEAGG